MDEVKRTPLGTHPYTTSRTSCNPSVSRPAIPKGKKKLSQKDMYQGVALNPVPCGVSDEDTLVFSHGAGPGIWTLRHQQVAPAWRDDLGPLGDARGRHRHARWRRTHGTRVVGPIHHLQPRTKFLSMAFSATALGITAGTSPRFQLIKHKINNR
jgi:hypothetical protein